MKKTVVFAAVVIVGIGIPAIYLLARSSDTGYSHMPENGGVQAQGTHSRPAPDDKADPRESAKGAQQGHPNSPADADTSEICAALSSLNLIPEPWRYDLVSLSQFEREDEILASWPPYDPELVEGLPSDLSVRELVDFGRRKVQEFWENGGIVGEGACQCIYAARASLERACRAEPANEIASVLLLEALQAYVPETYAFLLKIQDQTSFDNAFAKWTPKLKHIMGLNPYIAELRVRHYTEVISKKAPEDVTPWDMALVRDLLCARGYDLNDNGKRGLVLAAMALKPQNPEVQADFELKLLALNKLSRDGRIELTDWAIGVCEKRGWTDLKEGFSVSRATLTSGGTTTGVNKEPAWRVLSPGKADLPTFERRSASFLGPGSRAKRLVFEGDTGQATAQLSGMGGFLSRIFETP